MFSAPPAFGIERATLITFLDQIILGRRPNRLRSPDFPGSGDVAYEALSIDLADQVQDLPLALYANLLRVE